MLLIKFERQDLDECFEFVWAEGLLGYNCTCLSGCSPESIEVDRGKHMGAVDGVDSPRPLDQRRLDFWKKRWIGTLSTTSSIYRGMA